MKHHVENINQAAAFVDACSNFVAQLDKHQSGGAMFVCCIALLLVGVVVVALTLPLRAAQPSCDDMPKARRSTRGTPTTDNHQQPRK
ncbi:hypothetical protein C0Z18_26385 [Trinickia dabaoshanensis]|uniref:Uncharacterized protein n=1 Tax=Trinickia dabaoshanensis TaxID=564714 RepID=A0A2N7VEH4_9BURK|nr:hypothetical protein [Trinickia dabaoshanensis]PMS15559.1 hypothetical protein C0Z18_26385 [Trinickia dabaoshanensis]